MTRLTTLDLPQLHRATVGFDRMFQDMFDSNKSTGYPPYNIVQNSDDEYIISVAVAGFDMDNLDITLEKSVLTIEGKSTEADENTNYLYKGIAGRGFSREFRLADHIEVVGATLELGMLNIQLKREVPEALQPKKININTIINN
jgi:molecular chaperone IbpA